jgi:hypothetical protein
MFVEIRRRIRRRCAERITPRSFTEKQLAPAGAMVKRITPDDCVLAFLATL